MLRSKTHKLDVIPGHPCLVDSLGKAFNACPDCSFKACPKANDPIGLSEVCDEMSETRVAQIAKGNWDHKEKLDARSACSSFEKKPIKYSKMKANAHGWAEDINHEKCMEYLCGVGRKPA